MPVEQTVAFELEPEKKRLTGKDCEKFEALYSRGWRTIYRWVQLGEEKGVRCPISSPEKMPEWWAKVSSHRVPPELERAAADAIASQKLAAPATTVPPKDEASDTSPPVRPKYNLEDFDPEQGDQLRRLKQILTARYKEIEDALAKGTDTTLLESRYFKQCETVDKIESRAIERLQKQGIYILRAEVDADLAANAELLRQSQESMERRVLELCTSLTGEQRAEVAAAIRRARAAEEKTLCRLNVLTPDELTLELSA